MVVTSTIIIAAVLTNMYYVKVILSEAVEEMLGTSSAQQHS